MKITFLGGADEVGASCSLIEMGGKKILVDAGIRISPKTSRGLQNDQLPHLAHLSDVGGPDVILITHAHTDHTGAIAQVVRSYPRVPIYATKATIELSRVLLTDSSRLMDSRYEAEGELPLYDQRDVDLLLENWQEVDFRRALKLGADLAATYHPSGHIAGAGMIVFESPEGTLVMSGDLSLSKQRTVVNAQPPKIRADALVLESTYGGRLHANRDLEEKRLIETIQKVTEGGGKVLIPAFALGRAQEVLQIMLAYHDQINVPVYADGMVRAVCDAYSGFSEILPKSTVKMAGKKPLFFRENVHPVRSRKQREEILRSNQPMVVVASSGMLTGGASVQYAATFAGDERNAIFLTGYQDEESPGRFLQNVMRRKDQGETPTLRLGDKSVPLRCHLGTYSLSAHADENELISIAEAMDAQRIFLVHGDHEARGSLWDKLKQRGRAVSRPKAGQEKSIARRRRLKLNREEGETDTPPAAAHFEAEELWTLVKTHQGETFTARELAQIWFGDVERHAEITSVLEDDGVYFSQDWRIKSNFTVKKGWQVEQARLGRWLMREHKDMTNHLVVMVNSNDQPRLGLVQKVEVDGFVGIMQGSRAVNHPGHALIWDMGEFPGETDKGVGAIKKQLNALATEAETIVENVIPYAKRQLLAAENKVVDPEQFVTPPPVPFPEGEEGEKWEHRMLIEQLSAVLALTRDGAKRVDGGLLVERALPNGPVNQQIAHEVASNAFPPEAGLRKVGLLAHKHTIILNFDFPEVARDKYKDAIEAIQMETGWEANVKMTTNQQALVTVVRDVLPTDAEVVKGPSLYMGERTVAVEVDSADDEAISTAEQKYHEMTGYTLRVTVRGDANATSTAAAIAVPTKPDSAATTESSGGPMEINAAYAFIRQKLEPLGLQKSGLKQGEIVLTFISPQVGARHQEAIAEAAAQTGYAMRVHPNPMQNLILDAAAGLMRRAGWNVSKGPGIHVDRAEVSVRLADPVGEADFEAVSAALEEKTGYRVVMR